MQNGTNGLVCSIHCTAIHLAMCNPGGLEGLPCLRLKTFSIASQITNMETLRLWLSAYTMVLARLNLNGCRKYTVGGHWSQQNDTGITNQVDLRIRAINVSASAIWELKEAEYYLLDDIQCNGTISYTQYITHCHKIGSISTGYEGTTVQWAWRGWGW